MTDSSIVSECSRPALLRTPTLPYEVIQLIIECYIDLRAEEVRKPRLRRGRNRGRINRRKEDGGTVAIYPILPMLTTSKWFHNTTIPLIYKDISLNSSEAVNGFIIGPSFDSYKHVKHIHVGFISDSFIPFRSAEQHSDIALVHLSGVGAYDVLERLNEL